MCCFAAHRSAPCRAGGPLRRERLIVLLRVLLLLLPLVVVRCFQQRLQALVLRREPPCAVLLEAKGLPAAVADVHHAIGLRVVQRAHLREEGLGGQSFRSGLPDSTHAAHLRLQRLHVVHTQPSRHTADVTGMLELLAEELFFRGGSKAASRPPAWLMQGPLQRQPAISHPPCMQFQTPGRPMQATSSVKLTLSPLEGWTADLQLRRGREDAAEGVLAWEGWEGGNVHAHALQEVAQRHLHPASSTALSPRSLPSCLMHADLPQCPTSSADLARAGTPVRHAHMCSGNRQSCTLHQACSTVSPLFFPCCLPLHETSTTNPYMTAVHACLLVAGWVLRLGAAMDCVPHLLHSLPAVQHRQADRVPSVRRHLPDYKYGSA